MSEISRGLQTEHFELYSPNGSILIPPTLMAGSGDMVAPDLDTEQLTYLARAVDDAQRPIEDSETADCFDPRGDLKLGDGTLPAESKQRARMAGADTMTAFMMVQMLPQRWTLYPQGVERLPIDQQFNIFVDRASQFFNLGAHGPKCGAAAGFPALVENQFKLYSDISAGMADVMQSHYDPRVHESIRNVAMSKVDNGTFSAWDAHLVTDRISPSSHEFTHLDSSGENNGYAPLAKVANNRPGSSLHKPALQGPDGNVIQVFQYDTPAIVNLAHTLSNNEEEFVHMTHAGIAMQEDGAATLGANMRTIILK